MINQLTCSIQMATLFSSIPLHFLRSQTTPIFPLYSIRPLLMKSLPRRNLTLSINFALAESDSPKSIRNNEDGDEILSLLQEIAESFDLPLNYLANLPNDLRLDLNDAAFDLSNGPVLDEVIWSSLRCSASNVNYKMKCSKPVTQTECIHVYNSFFAPLLKLKKISSKYLCLNINKLKCWQEKLRPGTNSILVPLVVGIMIIMSANLTVTKSPSWALTEENLLFLEAWRTIDRAYVDKTFNGRNWFRYREDVLRNEPMNTREETYEAIRKMLSTLDDPFTRFLEPEKFKSLRSGTQGALTGVGLSIGYPTGLSESSTAGIVVISSFPGGPANRVGILPGDLIIAINDVSTNDMDIYDAADRLQGAEGTTVKLDIQSGLEMKHILLTRERVMLNPVKSRLCEITRTENDRTKIGYIKLSTFNQNASGAVKEAMQALRNNGVKSFVLDLRNNSGGLFPEGIQTAKIWLEEGVIVYICDSRGVRDIIEVDGGNGLAASEPLIVLVNKGTASASEILAGALKDNKRAVLYGEPTFGKGKIQSVFELSDGSGIVVTVARYETPAHIDIDKVGIIPDYPLPASFPLDEEGFCSSAAKLFSK